jgi:hypothetical protein
LIRRAMERIRAVSGSEKFSAVPARLPALR